MIPLLGLNNPIVTACVLCGTPLGHDSREMGWIVCNAHRSCSSCGCRVAMPEDIRLRYNDLTEREEHLTPDNLLTHARCLMLRAKSDATAFPVTVAQSHYDLLNYARLSVHPTVDTDLQTNIDIAKDAHTWYLATMSFEEKLRHVQILEAILAQTLIASKVTKIEIKATAERISTTKKASSAKTSSVAKARSVPAPTEKEISKPQYMDLARWKESYPKQWIQLSKSQQDQMKSRDKAISSYMKALQLPRESATDMVDGTNPLPWISEK